MGRKLALGVLAWMPNSGVVGLAVYLANYAAPVLFLGGAPNIDLSDPRVQHFLTVLIGGAAIIALLQLLFSIAFIIDAVTGAKLAGLSVALWALGFVFFGELLFPVYWLLHVMRASPAAGGAGLSPAAPLHAPPGQRC
jgi:hypothetical protein